ALDGSFDTLMELTTITIDTMGMDGTYDAYVYGWDGATPTSNYNTTSTVYATLVVNPSPVNTAPTLDWTGETNYAADGLNPEIGSSSTSFIYRVKYTDSDGDAPAANDPQLHIEKNGTEITGSPFTMIHESGSYSAGAIFSYSISLAEGDDYSYYFTSSDDQGASATPTTEMFAPYVSDLDTTPPSAPINLVVSSSDEEGELELSWDSNPEPDLDGYNIYRSTTSYEDPSGGTGYEFVETVSESRTSYTDTGLDDGRTYYYVTTAVDSSENESPFSNEASGTTKSVAEKEAVDYLWLWVFLAIIAGVHINLFLFLWARKRKRTEEEPVEEEEISEEEESGS
ncbi:MAG: fibronectin type III domain-containing protein, partial [Methanobacteriota archaeon]